MSGNSMQPEAVADDPNSWRSRLYAGYVSSGIGGTGAENAFASRSAFLKGVIRAHIPSDRDVRIVDLGCGAGAMLHFLQQAGYRQVRGVDGSAEMIALAHVSGFPGAQLADLRSYLTGQPDESLDVVLVIDVLEHFDRSALLGICDEIARVLVPGGRVVAHVPNAGGIFGNIVRFGDLTHELAFTQSSANQLLRTAGFEDVQCFEDEPAVAGWKSLVRYLIWKVGTLPARLLFAAETGTFGCILSQNMTCVARKSEKGAPFSPGKGDG